MLKAMAPRIEKLHKTTLPAIKKQLEAAGAPYMMTGN
jgi:hypothetical protein